MREHGGFEHNLQSLRVVDLLEQRYPDFDGLNLTFETREGILKHCSRRDAERLERDEPGGVAPRKKRCGQPSLEAQLTNLADEIAYNAHDIDDGVRSGLLQLEQLEPLALVQRHLAAVRREHPGLAGRRLLFEVIRRLLSEQVHDLVDASTNALAQAGPVDADAARHAEPLICFSPGLREQIVDLKRVLMRALYRHPQVVQTTAAAREVVRELHGAYLAHPAEMPADFASREDRHRSVADYIAGMTDRFATREHRRLFGRDAFPDDGLAPRPGG
jgi:dGTPase